MTSDGELPDPVRIVFADANVLYSRVLRDHLLYAADEEIMAVTWSDKVLEEVVGHLIENIQGFSSESATRLVSAMNAAFPYATAEPGREQYEKLAAYDLPDEDDRHVLAAAMAAEASVLCTANTKDFPRPVTAAFGITAITPDALLSGLISAYPEQMLDVHDTVVSRLPGATDDSTVSALRRAGAPTAAAFITRALEGRSAGQ